MADRDLTLDDDAVLDLFEHGHLTATGSVPGRNRANARAEVATGLQVVRPMGTAKAGAGAPAVGVANRVEPELANLGNRAGKRGA